MKKYSLRKKVLAVSVFVCALLIRHKFDSNISLNQTAKHEARMLLR